MRTLPRVLLVTCKQTFKTRVLVDSDSPLLLLSTTSAADLYAKSTRKCPHLAGHFLQNRLRTPSEALEKRADNRKMRTRSKVERYLFRFVEK